MCGVIACLPSFSNIMFCRSASPGAFQCFEKQAHFVQAVSFHRNLGLWHLQSRLHMQSDIP